MIKKLEDYISHIKKFSSQDLNEIESFKINFLGRKGVINDLFSNFKNVPADQKKEYGQKINELKNQPGIISSPMVGTVYLSPEPGVDPFIKVGFD